jgi:cation diffusion facilitator CzcD-associated flavoprotein CzcO
MASADRPTERLDAIIIGAGFSGIYLLHELRKRGFTAKIYEAADGLGGVWYANRYPGCRTDIEIPFYQLDTEEVWRGWTWKERFPTQPELQSYFRHVDQKKLEISRDTHFGTRVETAKYDSESDEWVVSASIGLVGRAKFLLPCIGYAPTPYIPDIPGLRSGTFKGHCFHSAAWPEGLDIKGKRVGIIGAGSTGVPLIQELGPVVGHLV